MGVRNRYPGNRNESPLIKTLPPSHSELPNVGTVVKSSLLLFNKTFLDKILGF